MTRLRTLDRWRAAAATRRARPARRQRRARKPVDGDAVAALLAATARGDRAAFGQLYDQVAAWVYGIALRVLHDRDTAQRAAAESLRIVWRDAPRFDGSGSSALGWIFGITYRTVLGAPPPDHRDGCQSLA